MQYIYIYIYALVKDRNLNTRELQMRHRKITTDASGSYTAWKGHYYNSLQTLAEKHMSQAGDNTLKFSYDKVGNLKS